MNKNMSKISGKIIMITILILGLSASNSGLIQENQVQKAKIYQEIYELLSETDLYCSFRIWTEEDPTIRIIGAEREYSQDIYSDGDVLYIDKGRNDGLEPGQLFLVLELQKRERVRDEDKPVHKFGDIARKRGRARIRALTDTQATIVLEKCCEDVQVGSYLVPFEPRETLMGKDLGYDVPPFESDGPKGEVVYLHEDYEQIGSGSWALVTLGEEHGIQVGQQLILYRVIREGAPLGLFGNVVVIDVQPQTSTVKVLSCRDAVRVGDMLMTRPSY